MKCGVAFRQDSRELPPAPVSEARAEREEDACPHAAAQTTNDPFYRFVASVFRKLRSGLPALPLPAFP
jgi:hypothetical protein